MPIHLSVTRRDFLQTTIGAGVLAISGLPSSISADDQHARDADRWVLCADTHIDANPETIARDVNMFQNLSKTIDEILASESRPSNVLINGDCAYLKGLPGDYETLAPQLQRLTDAGLNVHLTFGNHDDRQPCLQALEKQRKESAVDGKQVSVVETAHANFFLLDSLQNVNQVTGEFGAAQREWLSQAIDHYEDKPAILIGHHNLQERPSDFQGTVSGLFDTAEFLELMKTKQQIKAYIFGHTHAWSTTKTDSGVHLINLPPVAYLFDGKNPNGWVEAALGDAGMKLTLHALDKSHPLHASQHDFTWR
jgi:3',5'-cyclic AMP phosphodiesterase CpdA